MWLVNVKSLVIAVSDTTVVAYCVKTGGAPGGGGRDGIFLADVVDEDEVT